MIEQIINNSNGIFDYLFSLFKSRKSTLLPLTAVMIFKPLQLKRDTQASQYICYNIIYWVQYDKKQSSQDLT